MRRRWSVGGGPRYPWRRWDYRCFGSKRAYLRDKASSLAKPLRWLENTNGSIHLRHHLFHLPPVTRPRYRLVTVSLATQLSNGPGCVATRPPCWDYSPRRGGLRQHWETSEFELSAAVADRRSLGSFQRPGRDGQSQVSFRELTAGIDSGIALPLDNFQVKPFAGAFGFRRPSSAWSHSGLSAVRRHRRGGA